MVIHIGKNRLSVNKGFKPKPFAQFKKTYSLLGSEEELRMAYDKIKYGDNPRPKKKIRKTKPKSDSK